MQGIILTQILRKQFHLRNVPAVLACKFCKKKILGFVKQRIAHLLHISQAGLGKLQANFLLIAHFYDRNLIS